jgi:multiple sugar transport system permease protein
MMQLKLTVHQKSTILWKITTPLISPMLSYLIITGLMGGMKQYSAVVGVFGPQMGRDYDMGTMVGYIYSFLENSYYGYAFAGSLLLFVIIMIFTLINLQVSKKRVHY